MLENLAFLSSTSDWMIILVVVLILFGGKKIPELMKGVGRGVGELQKGLEEGKRAIFTAEPEEPAKPADTTAKPGDGANAKA